MRYFLLFLCAVATYAQPTNVSVTRTTHQQIVLSYNAPAGDDCSIELSESPTYAPVVPDVDSTLYTGSSFDFCRASTYIGGTRRMVVLGARVVDKANDGKRYS